MISLSQLSQRDRLNILCIGAHCDDIEIGCGATLLKLMTMSVETHVTWVIFSGDEARKIETRSSAAKFLRKSASSSIQFFGHRDSFFPYCGDAIKEDFSKIQLEYEPDLVFSHFKSDFHQDHRTIAEITWNYFRNNTILEYEIPKYDGGLQSPNVFVPVSTTHIAEKSEILMQSYVSQTQKPWFDKATFDAMMRIRGVECNSPSGYAEAYYCRKLVLV